MSRSADAGRALRVGVVVVLSLGLLAAGIWILGDTARLWSPKIEYRVKLRDVQGLSGGSIVSVAGYRIGTVKRIFLPDDITEGRVTVVLTVEESNRCYIRADTKAKIKTIGLLGDKYIELTPGTPQALELAPGAEIEAVQPVDLDRLLKQGETAAENLIGLSAGLRSIVDKVDSGQGILAAIINDTPEGRELMHDMRLAVAGLRSLTEKADQGRGTVGMLLNDRQAAGDLKAALASLQSVTRRLDQGDGFLARLLNDAEFARALSDNLTEASRQVRELTARVNQGQGLIGRLTSDQQLADELTGDLRRITASLSSITSRIEAGEGSLGKLIQDETLYQGVNDLLAGSRKSRLTRWFIQRSQKAGIEEREKREREAAAEPGAAGLGERPATAGPQ